MARGKKERGRKYKRKEEGGEKKEMGGGEINNKKEGIKVYRKREGNVKGQAYAIFLPCVPLASLQWENSEATQRL